MTRVSDGPCYPVPMVVDVQSLVLSTGAVLLGVAAFMGFVQARTERGSQSETRWRVVHNGGTAGGVQLLALAAVWSRLTEYSGLAPSVTTVIAIAIVAATWAFFVGPLLNALSRPRWGRMVLLFGALTSLPGYGGLVVLAVA